MTATNPHRDVSSAVENINLEPKRDIRARNVGMGVIRS